VKSEERDDNRRAEVAAAALWLVGVVATLALTLAAGQQVTPPPPSDARDTLRVNASLVNMLFTVRDGKGRLVQHLDRSQFRVIDDEQPQQITYFSEQSDQPLALAILLDKSNSVNKHFEFERRATADFVRSILRPGKDQALLITFDKKPRLAVPFTDQPEKLVEAMAELKAEGGTALFDAAHLAIEHLGEAVSQRRVLVLVSDGEDTVSWTTQKEVLALAISHNVTVYTLGVKPDAPGSNASDDRRNLERLSEETGGLTLFPREKPEELAELFGRIEEEVRHQYSLGYAPPPPDGKTFHQVSIEPMEKTYRVHSRRGYYVSSVRARKLGAVNP
jgi:VWFA-related protein